MIHFDSMESLSLGMDNDELKSKLYELFFDWRTKGSSSIKDIEQSQMGDLNELELT